MRYDKNSTLRKIAEVMNRMGIASPERNWHVLAHRTRRPRWVWRLARRTSW